MFITISSPQFSLNLFYQGGIIHATIHHDHVSRFQPQLQVYGVYHIHHFHVDHSPFNHNTGDYEYELLFKRTTILQECLSDTIPFYGFVDKSSHCWSPCLVTMHISWVWFIIYFQITAYQADQLLLGLHISMKLQILLDVFFLLTSLLALTHQPNMLTVYLSN